MSGKRHHHHYHHHTYAGTPPGGYPHHGNTHQQPSCPPMCPSGPQVQPPPYQGHGHEVHYPVFVNPGPICPPPPYEPPHQHHVPQRPPAYVHQRPPAYVPQGPPPCGTHVPHHPPYCQPEKKPKKKSKKLKKTLVYGLPVLALGVGAYAVGKAHGKNCSSSDSD